MTKYFTLFIAVSIISLNSCIKDDFVQDFVEPEVRITNQIDTLGVDSTFTFQARFFNNVGQRETVALDWTSSDESIVTVNSEGVARGVQEGNASIDASYNFEGETIVSSADITVGAAILPPPEVVELREKEGVIQTTTFYELEGDFTFKEEENGITIDIKDNYIATSALPGLFIYLSNNRNSIANALEIGAVDVFTGAHTYSVEDVGYEDYTFIVYFCKPFNIKVGEAEL